MKPLRRLLASLAILIVTVLGPPEANAEPKPIDVATRIIPPLVIEENGKLSGFSIELWDSISERLGLTPTYHVSPDVKSLLESVKSGKDEVGISAISITEERSRHLDFSFPMLDAGLQILVRGSGTSAGDDPVAGLMQVLLSPALLVWLGIAAMLVIVPAHIVWWLERKQEDGIVPDESYFPGIFHAMWWAAGTLATQGEKMPRHWLARLLAILWMFVGIVFVAFYTAQLTASLTVQEIHGAIRGPADLPGKRVATTRASTAATYLSERGAKLTEYATITEAVGALEKSGVDAVVFDAPVLLHYAAHDGRDRVRVVGPVFRKESYGIAFPPESSLRREVNNALLAMHEDGTYKRIYDRWFSSE